MAGQLSPGAKPCLLAPLQPASWLTSDWGHWDSSRYWETGLRPLLLLAVMLTDSCQFRSPGNIWSVPCSKEMQKSFSFSPVQTETKFQLPQIFIFLEITLSNQVSIPFFGRKSRGVCLISGQQIQFSPWLLPTTDAPGCPGMGTVGISEQVKFRDMFRLLQARNKIFA